MNWDDLRVVRAIFQTGSFAAAAGRLGVNETTVARRLTRLEQDLGVALFEAVDGKRRPTVYCDQVVMLTETIVDHVDRIATIGQVGETVVERRRIATTDSIAANVLAPRLPQCLERYPGLTLDLLVSNENVDFSRWEADIAIRLRRPEKGDFVVSRLADLELFLVEPGDRSAEDGALMCAYPEDLDATPESKYLERMGLQGMARCRTKNLQVLKRLVGTGQCAAVLPDYMCSDLMGAKDYRCTRLPRRRSVWLLVQRHLRRDPTTRAVIDWIKACMASARN